MSFVIINKVLLFYSKFLVQETTYTLLNTLLFSVFGIFFYFFIVYPYLLLRKTQINFRFCFSVFFFVVIGSVIRVFSLSSALFLFSNASFSFLFEYPFLFFTLSLLFLIFFELFKFLSKKFSFDFERSFFFFSFFLMLFFLLILFFNAISFFLAFKLLFFSFLIFLPFYFLKLFFLKDTLSFLAFFSQILDGFITFYLTSFHSSFVEKHVISSFLLSINALLYLLVKILFCLLVLFFIHKFTKDNFPLNNYFKLFIIIIGFSTALRNLFFLFLLTF